MSDKEEKSCCFFGHRKINETEELKNRLCDVIEDLIVNKNVDTFLFGSNSRFDSFCPEVVTEIKERYPHIKRIYVRSVYKNLDDWCKDILLEKYEDTYFPEQIENSGRASYVERNQDMINQSKFCVIYYDESYLPPRRKNSRREVVYYQPKSGTKVAYDYAIKKKKEIINVFLKR